ncbi:hypothetical protein TNCV_3053631 [Trichonephila clavipes]|uniref:Uncharacterized protein n=1 Tax=Trichonephila clavipes TaxID=2585209 RepID=A0A8X6V0B7_TRICX|nr:hypothetical protein TNCV_3053631 [Trichonephila clavipes]
MGRAILLERRQSESVGRRNSRSTFLRSDWPRPFTRREFVPTHGVPNSLIGCLIGDKSGDQADQGRVVTVQRQSCDTLAV